MKEVLIKIKPKKEEVANFIRSINSFLKTLNSKLKDAKAILGGSGAKDTWLSGSHDVDIFVQFNYKKYSKKSSDIADILQSKLKKSFPNINRIHGSRDYFQLKHDGFQIEIIPILEIKKAEDAINITDVSPLHSKWVNQHTKNLKDEIRLAKQFCKAQKLYGAESYIQGLSGYVLEILIVKYGSFNKLLQSSKKWKNKEVIDVAKHYPKGDATFHLNKSKQISPLIIVVPVD